MFTLFIRCTILYVVILFIFRLMGKRQLGELQPFELVIALIVADLATVPMADTNIPLLNGIIPLITLLALHYLISLLARKSIVCRKIVSGKPVIVIDTNGINYKNLKNLNMNLNDLMEALRNATYFSFDDVAYAIVETNGSLTVLPKANKSPITVEDMQIKKENSTIPYMLVCDGKIMEDNLKLAKVDQQFVNNFSKKIDCKNIKEVLIMTLDSNGKLFLQAKIGNAKTIENAIGGNYE